MLDTRGQGIKLWTFTVVTTQWTDGGHDGNQGIGLGIQTGGVLSLVPTEHS